MITRSLKRRKLNVYKEISLDNNYNNLEHIDNFDNNLYKGDKNSKCVFYVIQLDKLQHPYLYNTYKIGESEDTDNRFRNYTQGRIKKLLNYKTFTFLKKDVDVYRSGYKPKTYNEIMEEFMLALLDYFKIKETEIILLDREIIYVLSHIIYHNFIYFRELYKIIGREKVIKFENIPKDTYDKIYNEIVKIIKKRYPKHKEDIISFNGITNSSLTNSLTKENFNNLLLNYSMIILKENIENVNNKKYINWCKKLNEKNGYIYLDVNDVYKVHSFNKKITQVMLEEYKEIYNKKKIEIE